MSKMKRRLEDILTEITYEQRIVLLMDLGYSSEDARDYAEAYESNEET